MKNLFLCLMAVLLWNTVQAQSEKQVEGTWLTQEGDSRIEIKLMDDGTFEGQIVWLKKPKYDDGSNKKDINNPDASLQQRELLGLKLLEGFKYDGSDNEWVDGTIYDPRTGSTYKCYMWFEDDMNELFVKGYIGVSLIGKKVKWTRITNEG